jgi:hypothetical protein
MKNIHSHSVNISSSVKIICGMILALLAESRESQPRVHKCQEGL